jgi:hypothetical protein
MQVRWAVLLREEPSSKDYRGAVSSNLPYGPLAIGSKVPSATSV